MTEYVYVLKQLPSFQIESDSLQNYTMATEDDERGFVFTIR